MRLINPGVGELIDRLVILDLKITFYDRPYPQQAERDAVAGILKRTYQLGPEQLGASSRVYELRVLHDELWQATDAVRRYRTQKRPLGEGEMVPVAKLAFRMQELNDRRAELVHALNRVYGDGYPEKGQPSDDDV